jgi:hypothetical protein
MRIVPVVERRRVVGWNVYHPPEYVRTCRVGGYDELVLVRADSFEFVPLRDGLERGFTLDLITDWDGHGLPYAYDTSRYRS